jgi:hypothetical protein
MLTMAAMLIALSGAGHATAADRHVAGQRACLSKAEQRAAISHGQAVTLATAIRAVRGRGVRARGRGAREVVRAQLCRESGGLVYVLTVLARNGKVTHMTVDASSGNVVHAR